jgi:signal peptidase II
VSATQARIEAGARALALAIVVIGADQASKALVVHDVVQGTRVKVLPFLHLANVRNPGVAFGLFGHANAVLIAITVVVLCMILGYLSRGGIGPRFWVSGGLLVGGAMSNLADRVRIGSVVDWIDLPHWPTFNLADVAIVAGVICLVLLPPGKKAEEIAGQ